MKYMLGGIILIFLAFGFFYLKQGQFPENGIALASDEFQLLNQKDDFVLIDIRNERELEETFTSISLYNSLMCNVSYIRTL